MTKHHTPHGFYNPWLKDNEKRNFFGFLRWMKERREGKTKKIHLSHEQVDLAFLHENRTKPLIMWLGHSTFLLQIDGLNILTDPMLGQRASPTPLVGPERLTPPAIHAENLPNIDLVLISHNHYDHLDFGTVKKLYNKQNRESPEFIVPQGVYEWFKRRNIRSARELDWWEETVFGDWTITSVPAQHFSGRTMGDHDASLWCGWVMRKGDFRFYFAGDSGYGSFFQKIGHRLGPMNLSAIPIGGYKPKWFMHPVHVNPEEAVQIHKDVRSDFSIGMHWGTFQMTDEDMDEPPKRLEKACKDQGVPVESFKTLKPGEIVYLDNIPNNQKVDAADVRG